MFIRATDSQEVRLTEEEYAALNEYEKTQVSLQDSITVRKKMSFGVKTKVLDAMSGMISAQNDSSAFGVNIGSYQLTLLRKNILAWNGPSFMMDGKLIPCTEQNIDQFDPDNPLVKKTLEIIGEANVAKRSPDPKSHTQNGSTTVGEVDSAEVLKSQPESLTSTLN